MKTTLAICLLLSNQIAVFFESKTDAAQAKRGEKVDHIWSAFLRCFAWLELSLTLNIASSPGTGYLFESAIMFCVFASTFWLTFDYWYNHFSNNNWYYTNKGLMDSILSGYDNRFLRLAFKIILAIGSIGIFYSML